MIPLRVLIVKDELRADDQLSRLLSQIDGIEVAGPVDAGPAAVSAVASYLPDLVLLVIGIPGFGLNLVDRLANGDWPQGKFPPLICFVTARKQFALNAFERGAFDFLCRPVTPKRLEKTIARARELRGGHELTPVGEQDIYPASPGEGKLWVRQKRAILRIDIADVDWIEAYGEFVWLHSGDTSHLMRGPLREVTRQLECDGFVRVHRSATINRSRLEVIRKTGQNFSAVLSSGATVPVGRAYRRSLPNHIRSVRSD